MIQPAEFMKLVPEGSAWLTDEEESNLRPEQMIALLRSRGLDLKDPVRMIRNWDKSISFYWNKKNEQPDLEQRLRDAGLVRKVGAALGESESKKYISDSKIR